LICIFLALAIVKTYLSADLKACQIFEPAPDTFLSDLQESQGVTPLKSSQLCSIFLTQQPLFIIALAIK